MAAEVAAAPATAQPPHEAWEEASAYAPPPAGSSSSAFAAGRPARVLPQLGLRCGARPGMSLGALLATTPGAGGGGGGWRCGQHCGGGALRCVMPPPPPPPLSHTGREIVSGGWP